MSAAVVPFLRPVSSFLTDPKMLNLIRNTHGKECNDTQFDEFIHICRAKRLDPLQRQIYCWVINKGKRDSDGNSLEQMIPIIGIGGYRSLAVRCGDYMPSDKEPRITRRKDLIDAGQPLSRNPQGLVSITVWVKKRDSAGVWHEFSGRAKWDEYAPFKEQWTTNPNTGKDEPNGIKFLPKNHKWYGSPEMMLEKCSEAQALRKGWPEDYANVYEEAEFDRHKVVELTPSEYAREGEITERLRKIGGPGLMVEWEFGAPFVNVPVGQFADAVMEFIAKHEHTAPKAIINFRERNRITFEQFWAHRKSDAQEVRRRINAIQDKLEGRAPRQPFQQFSTGKGASSSFRKTD